MRFARLNAACRLVALAALGAATWLVALPRLAETDAMTRRLAAADRAGVDPGAIFWTEHPRGGPRR